MVLSVADSFYREYFEFLPKGFDDVYILHANSGEVYCFLAYLAKAHIKKTGAQNPLFVATKPYHEDIIKLFFPKARYVYYNMYLTEPRLGILGDAWTSQGHNFWQIFSQRHFNTVNSNLGQIHYFDAMLSTLGLTREDVTKPVVKIPVSEKKEVTKIAEKIQLNTDKFVIIAPEASTSNLLPISFWRTLVKELYSRGYDVFLNATKLNEIKAKTHTLSYTELFLLSSMAKGVISLRSGVSEFLIPSKAKNITLAPRFHWSPALTAEQCIRAYSVMKLPFIDTNQVHEINPELYLSEDNLVKEIINLL